MATAARDWASGTRTGHPVSNLVLLQMATRTKNRLGNWIYTGHREDLASVCEIDPPAVDWALETLTEKRLLVFLDAAADGESWVCFPRVELDLGTLREWWRNPVKGAKYQTPNRTVRLAVYRRDGFKCLACHWAPPVPADYNGSHALTEFASNGRVVRCLELDHKIPRAAGGKSEIGNLQTLCTPCNASKGSRV